MEPTEDQDVDLSEMGLAEIQQIMRDNFVKNAIEKPWSWEWKYTMAHQMFKQGRDIFNVKKMLGLTYPWLLRHKLITWDSYQNRYITVLDAALAQ